MLRGTLRIPSVLALPSASMSASTFVSCRPTAGNQNAAGRSHGRSGTLHGVGRRMVTKLRRETIKDLILQTLQA